MAKSSAVSIGWYTDAEYGDFVFPAPRVVKESRSSPLSGRAVQACPAVNELERRIFQIDCPFHMHLELEKNRDSYDLFIVDKTTRIDRDIASKFIKLMPPEIWRNPARPVIQIFSPYIFFADEEVFMQQVSPFLDYSSQKWPGVLIPGRFPIMNWMRPLNWAFEWIDTTKAIRLKEGQPFYYLQFETTRPSDPIEMVRAKVTKEVSAFKKGCGGAPKFVSNTFKLMDVASQRRPEKLLVPESS